MASLSQVLIFDRDSDTAEVLREVFSESETRFIPVGDLAAFRESFEAHRFDAVVLGESDSELGPLGLLRELKRSHSLLPVLVTLNDSSSESAIEIVKAGAFDFLSKPLLREEIEKSLREAMDCSRKAGSSVLIDPNDERDDFSDTLVGTSRAMMDVYKSLGRLSSTPVTVLIRGETGTGKELVARALYQHGHRAHRPFITVNCAAIPENLLESELFGHEKGAFTGATSNRIGKFEQAHEATLFLDEIGDLDHSLQAKLLRVLQEKRFQRVGGNKEILTDVRIIAATHQPIERMINEGNFREDLFYRLNVASIKLPPLRDRAGDVPVLAGHFLQRLGSELGLPRVGISRAATQRLESAPLPGNVRQLQNIIRRALLRSRGYEIDRALIDLLLHETDSGEFESEEGLTLQRWSQMLVDSAENDGVRGIHSEAMESLERVLFDETLRRCGGNISHASQWLGISRITLREKSKRYGILKS
ncbi:sigma-54 dependent transcriptional regulator [Verrucomicrobiales bacterium]|nr:sigma-54 dependent transcriptional regulator [Verrucomicrobiales bacterium]MDA7926777.1 sigma-54 dependent transcriptional regulator [Verrucomicrobiales bacterium]